MEIKLALGMISALFASGAWLIIASVFGWPVSTTHTIIGSLIGFALVTTDASSVHWSVIAGIFGSWIITPAISGLIAYLLFVAIQRTIFIRFHPFAKAKSMAPYFIALTFFILSIVTMQNGLKHVGIIISNAESLVLSLIIALVASVAGAIYLRYKKFPSKKERKTRYENVERVFTILLIITACAMAFAHGSNDVANAVGPLSSVANPSGMPASLMTVSISSSGQMRPMPLCPNLRLSASTTLRRELRSSFLVNIASSGLEQLTPSAAIPSAPMKHTGIFRLSSSSSEYSPRTESEFLYRTPPHICTLIFFFDSRA